MKLRLTLILVSLLIVLPSSAGAQIQLLKKDAPPASEVSARSASAGQQDRTYPGVAEVIPRLSRLSEESAEALQRIAELQKTEALKADLGEMRQQVSELLQAPVETGAVSRWSVHHLQEVRGRLAEQRESLQKILDRLSERGQQLEGLRSAWREKKEFWQSWRAKLEESPAKVPVEAFDRAQERIARVLEEGDRSVDALLLLQEQVTALLDEIHSLSEVTAQSLRQETFAKNAPTFLDPEFYRQFDAELWNKMRSGVQSVDGIGLDFLRQQGWILMLQILLALVIGGAIVRYRRHVEISAEWRFILDHPWTTGVFSASAALGFLYSYPPALWEFGLWVVTTYTAARLMAALLQEANRILVIRLLAIFFVLTLVLQLIAFPQPLYRLYLALVALFGTPFLLLMGRRIRGTSGKSGGFVFALWVGALVLFIAFAAQFGGYRVLSFRLIESSIKTIFVGLIAAMVIRLGQGAIGFALEQDVFRHWRFFRRFGRDLSFHLKRLFQVAVLVYAGFYLLVVWGLYDAVLEAWEDLLRKGFSMGRIEVSVRMVVVAAGVIYASIAISWVIRSLLEAEVFPRRKFDRGIRDSIKKLLHYGFIIFGLVLALIATGVELQNFAVLAGAFGIGIGFGMQNIVNNFVSGLILLFERPVKVGDLIIVSEEWGTVRKIGLRSTVVTTLDESEIIVPNSDLISEKVTNWSLSSPLCRVSVPVGVAYGSDVPLVLRILLEVGEALDEVLKDPSPSPLFSGFGNSSLDFELRVWISDVRNRLRIRSEICQYIDRRFREEGVEIPFPQRDLHLRSVDEKVFGDPGEGKRFPVGGWQNPARGKGGRSSAPDEPSRPAVAPGTTPGKERYEKSREENGEDDDGD